MEPQKPRIELYVKRPFGEKMNASFDFIKENWKPLIQFITYLLLPLSLIQALSMNGLMTNYMGVVTKMGASNPSEMVAALPQLFTSYSVTILCCWVGNILATSLIYALLKTYAQREERLKGITLTAIRPLLLHNMVQMLKMTLFVGLLMVLVIAIIAGLVRLTPFTLLLTLPLLVAVVVPLALYAPVYLLEEITLVQALKKTLRLGFATWGGIFAISLVMGIIAYIFQMITGTPWSIAFMVKSVFSLSDTGGEATVSVGYNFLLYLFGVLQAFGGYVAAMFTLVGIAYQYGHASEVVDSVSVENDIENFDKL